jgi:hypothetical protein
VSTAALINGDGSVSRRRNSLPSLTLRRPVGPLVGRRACSERWRFHRRPSAAALWTNRRAAGQRRSCRRMPGGALISWSFNEPVDRDPGRRLPLIRCGVGRWPRSAADGVNQIFNTSVDRSEGRIYDQIDSPRGVREASRPRRPAAGTRVRTNLLGGHDGR